MRFLISLILLFESLTILTVNATNYTNEVKLDTIYIKNDILVILDNGKKHEVENIINTNNTLIKRSNVKNIFYLIYDYSASVIKSKNIVKLQWVNEKLRILKEGNFSYDSEKQVDFGWFIFYHNKDYTDVEQLGTLINYDLIKGKSCKHQVQIYSKVQKFNEEICLKKARQIPVFYEDGSLIGKYEYLENSPNDVFIYLNLTENLAFSSVSDFKAPLPLNDIAYFLEQSGNFHEASILLEKITGKFPEHTVAYVNLGDAYWGLKDTAKAKTAYEKYIDLMKKSGKEAKIPKRVLDRVK